MNDGQSKLGLGSPHFLGPPLHRFAPAWWGKRLPNSASCRYLNWKQLHLLTSSSLIPPPLHGHQAQALPSGPSWEGAILFLIPSQALSSLQSSAFPWVCSCISLSRTPGLGFPAGASPLFCVAQGQPHCPVVQSTLPISFLLEAVLERS